MDKSPRPALPRLLTSLLLALADLGAAAAADPAPALGEALQAQVRQLALEATRAGPGAARVEIEVGRLDPRLRLAPCQRVEPHLPPGTRLWGKARIGLRCVEGPSPWNVYLPITVHVYGRALVAAAALPAGAVLGPADLREAEVDLAEDASPVLARPEPALGRSLTRALAPGQGLRLSHLKPRVWFAAGDTVKILALGSGFAVAGAGQALGPGIEGQATRVRTESGRIVSGLPVAERQVEVSP